MLFGKRESRSVVARRRGAYRPKPDGLEERLLLAIDLGGVAPPAVQNPNNPLPTIATHFYGVDLAGANTGLGAGFSVSDVGDVNLDGFDDFFVGAPTVTTSFGLGGGGNSTAFLIFGSRQVSSAQPIINWLQLSNGNTGANNRVGTLTQLGNTVGNQQNPITGTPIDFPFSGLRFTVNTPNSQ